MAVENGTAGGAGAIGSGAIKDDMGSHVRTYDRMIRMFKVGGIAVALVTALVIWLIAG